jgi:hypothetical protein
MNRFQLPLNAKSVIRHVRAFDNAAGTTLIADRTELSSFTANYVAAGGTLTSLTVVSITTLGTWDTAVVAGKIGIKPVSDANAPGLLEVHFPDEFGTSLADTITVKIRATDAFIDDILLEKVSQRNAQKRPQVDAKFFGLT